MFSGLGATGAGGVLALVSAPPPLDEPEAVVSVLLVVPPFRRLFGPPHEDEEARRPRAVSPRAKYFPMGSFTSKNGCRKLGALGRNFLRIQIVVRLVSIMCRTGPAASG